MALGFIKKIFSFGKKEVEEVPAEEVLHPKEALPTVEQTYEDTAAEEALPVADDVEAVADERVEDRGAFAEREAIDEPAPEPDLLPEIEPAIIYQVEIDVTTAEEAGVAEVESPPAFVPPVQPAETTAPEEETVVDETPEISAEAVELPMDEVEIEPVAVPAPEAPTAEVAEPLPTPAKQSPSKVTVSRTVEEKQADEPIPVAPEKRLAWFERLRKGLSRSSQQLGDSIGGIFTKRKLDEDTLQDLEDVLIQADLGMETAIRITDSLSATRYGKDISTEEVRTIMASEIEKVLGPVAKPLELDLSHKPHVILVVGVNGTGKTTTIGKLAAKLTAGGLNVMLAAGDTFRAAAIEQLHIWGKRTGAPVVSSKLGADAAGLAFDAWKQAKEAGSDVLIIDTAGRLQNRAELMDELAKIVRVLGKNDPEAPHTVLQTLDATTGQNALNQVEIFKNIAGVNGLVMTKLDGTARGGILVAISAKHKLPVYFIGVGEQVDDLEPFAARDFAKAIAGVA
ncbi:signal recognition particle-docking protein FtsY [Phyllobacterium brassicacearum]|uniref:Signal recognition particle receptor FtsY n=1 Tax=Phyllobacterium brassicacearum TaxID=314235 RepID=A0A2P7BJM1_9HYPH|nr:signal recognition particle-docking protein FtsY [Phyllobacterium brassicacearum]PSH66625.1 signal recognition particle-docking protein FtsY [Phyllobacterium brassicacearum]TDQ23630.1 signal recognition particle-docking protein FtsY [Phyllobacterium brassicacearum]